MNGKKIGPGGDFKPHKLLQKYLIPALQNFVGSEHVRNTQIGQQLQNFLHGRGSNQFTIQIHKMIQILGKGFFNNFESFTLQANAKYGTLRRPRFDFCEIVLPQTMPDDVTHQTSGFKRQLRVQLTDFANSPDLLRPSTDTSNTALARILGIISLSYTCKLTPLLVVQFYRKIAFPVELDMLGLKHVFSGISKEQWVYVTPLLTLKAPVLGIECSPSGSTYFYTMQYLSRGNWLPLPSRNFLSPAPIQQQLSEEIMYESGSDLSDLSEFSDDSD